MIVGSGVSISATGNAPAASWGGLLKLGVDRCQQVAKGWRKRTFDSQGILAKLASSNVSDWIAAATMIESTLRTAGGTIYKDWLAETVGKLRPTQPDVLHTLGMLGVPLATTNYDALIERSLVLQAMTWRTPGLIDQLMNGTYPGDAVLHLHGHYSEPSSVILGASSYANLLGDLRMQSTLRYLMQSRDMIFVGLGGGLDDPNFSALLDWANEVTLPESRYHFLLLRDADSSDWRAKLVLTSRIHVVSYGCEYSDLVPFLRSLVDSQGLDGTGRVVVPDWVRSASANVPVSRNLVRRAFFETLRADADSDAFCMDFFPETYRQFSSGMNRQEKVNLLLSREDPAQVLSCLRSYQRREITPSRVGTPIESGDWQQTQHRPSGSAMHFRDELPPPQPKRTRAKPGISALLHLDRKSQYGELLLGSLHDRNLNRLLLLHGGAEQNIEWFVRRVEEFLHDDSGCTVLNVPMVQNGASAKTGDDWCLHLNHALEERLDESRRPLQELLSLATQRSPLLLALVSCDNPPEIMATVSDAQRAGLRDFVTSRLPMLLTGLRRVTILLPLESRSSSAMPSLLAEAQSWAEQSWHNQDRAHAILPEVTFPTWADVDDYLRGHHPPLHNLPAVRQEAQLIYQPLSKSGSFEQLARALNDIVRRSC